MLYEIIFVSYAVFQALHTWLFKKSQEGPSNTVGDNISLLMLQFLAWNVRLFYVNNIPIESDTYLLEGLKNFLVE